MWGRYYRKSDKQKIAEAFHLGEHSEMPLEVAPSYNIAPSTMQPVIVDDTDSGERSPHADLLLSLPGLGNVIRGLHTHERVHLYSECFLNAERHNPGEISLAIEQAGQHRPRNAQRYRCRSDGQPYGFYNLRPNEISGMGRVLHGHVASSFGSSGNPLNSHRKSLARLCRYKTSSADWR